MANFNEIISFVTIALVITVVSCFPTSVETETADTAVGAAADITITGDHAGDSAPPEPVASPGVLVDSNCDCNDEEALFHKSIRQLIDSKMMKGKEEFLREFRIRKICGSDGNFYTVGCEFKCAQMKAGGETALHPVKGKSKCRKPEEDQPPKGKESQSDEPFPHPLVCICPRNYYPVCASNGITYGNRCVFECAKRNLKDMTIVTTGKGCHEDDKTILGTGKTQYIF